MKEKYHWLATWKEILLLASKLSLIVSVTLPWDSSMPQLCLYYFTGFFRLICFCDCHVELDWGHFWEGLHVFFCGYFILKVRNVCGSGSSSAPIFMGSFKKNQICILTDFPELIWNWLEYSAKVAKCMLTCARGVEFVPLRNYGKYFFYWKWGIWFETYRILVFLGPFNI